MLKQLRSQRDSRYLSVAVSLAMAFFLIAPVGLAADPSNDGELEGLPPFFSLTKITAHSPEGFMVSVRVFDCDGGLIRNATVSFPPAAPPPPTFRDVVIELALSDIAPQPLIWLVCEPTCQRLFCTITAQDGRSQLDVCPTGLRCSDFVSAENQSANDPGVLGFHIIDRFTAEGGQVVGNPIIQ